MGLALPKQHLKTKEIKLLQNFLLFPKFADFKLRLAVIYRFGSDLLVFSFVALTNALLGHFGRQGEQQALMVCERKEFWFGF